MTARSMRRYRIEVDGRPHSFPLTSDPLHIEAAGNSHVDMWVLHDPARFETVRTFQVFGTGHDLPPGARYIGTTGRTLASLIWHVFEIPSSLPSNGGTTTVTDSTYRHVVIIADRSGSMRPVARDTEQGIAAFIDDQAQIGGRTTVSLTQFDTEHDEVYSFRDIRENTSYQLHPRGGTALLDAIGFTFTRTGERLAALPEDARPHEVVVLIATDGEENSSREYTLHAIKTMITHQQEVYGWKVVYCGANQDAFTVGASLGVPAATTLNYNTTATASTFASASSMVVRGAQTGVYGFNPAERKAAVGGTPTPPPPLENTAPGCASSQSSS